ncbi:MAG: cell division protein SepF [Candidatus Jordarchaeales archaeon]
MVIARLFKRNGGGHGSAQGIVPDPRRYFSYPEESEEFNISAPEEIYIKSIPLIMLSDIQKVVAELRAGNIIILHIRPILQRDKTRNELKRAVDQLRGICRQLDGDIAQLGGEYIVVTPGPFVKIYKPEQKKTEEKNEEVKEENKIENIGVEYAQPALATSRRPANPAIAKLDEW